MVGYSELQGSNLARHWKRRVLLLWLRSVLGCATWDRGCNVVGSIYVRRRTWTDDPCELISVRRRVPFHLSDLRVGSPVWLFDDDSDDYETARRMTSCGRWGFMLQRNDGWPQDHRQRRKKKRETKKKTTRKRIENDFQANIFSASSSEVLHMNDHDILLYFDQQQLKKMILIGSNLQLSVACILFFWLLLRF